jgi:hypothetical protein
MTIALTSIKLRSVWNFFTLSWHGYKISRQAKSQTGFIKIKSNGFGYFHYTITAWQNADDMKAFVRTGAHLDAMKISKTLCTEIATCSYSAEQIPSWREAKLMLEEKGNIIRF